MVALVREILIEKTQISISLSLFLSFRLSILAANLSKVLRPTDGTCSACMLNTV